MTPRQVIAAVSLALALGGCTGVGASRSCFVGFNLLPPSPVVVCGVDVESSEEKGK